MKPAAPRSGAQFRFQHGAAAVELALILSATIVLMPAVALFAKVFFQYSVIKGATRDAATYLATLPIAAVKDEAERTRALGVAEQIVRDAAAGAGLTGSTTVATPIVECDNHPCYGLVPDVFIVTTTLSINDELFAALTGPWTDYDTSTWQVSATSTIPFSK
jgi:Flp pilus assembly protein TadG